MNSKNIFIILVEPITAGNIGATARAVKNMGFSKLRLVKPRKNWRKQAEKMACNAGDILKQAEIFPDLQSAVEDLCWTAGTTCRLSERRGKFMAFDKFVDTARVKTAAGKVGIIFGREDKGLNNTELDCCDRLVSLPADEAYPSMNLAQAVMVSVFSLAREKLAKSSRMGRFEESAETLLDKTGVQRALRAMEEALECAGFYKGKDGRLDRIMKMTETLFKRAGMHEYESQMIKGVSARIIQRLSEKK